MTNVSTWSITAGLNNSSPPNGWPEGMARSAVNDTAREMMAALARWYRETTGVLTTAGTGNDYTLTTGSSHATTASLPILVFTTDRGNTGPITLNVDGLGPETVYRNVGSYAEFASGDIDAGQLMVVVHNAFGWYEYLGPFVENFPVGTTMVFGDTAAPTGWVKGVTHTNKALRLTTGTVTTGGSTGFTSVFTSRSIAVGNLPSHTHNQQGSFVSSGTSLDHTHSGSTNAMNANQNHTHSIPFDQTGAIDAASGSARRSLLGTGTNTGSVNIDHFHTFTTGGVSSDHTHTTSISGATTATGSGTALDFAVQYVDVILAVKS
jgi:hypothetical protein